MLPIASVKTNVLYIYICFFITKVMFFLLVVNYNKSVFHSHEDTEPYIFRGNDLDLLGSCDVIGHMAIGLGKCGFLLVVRCNHASNLHHYGDMKPQSSICP